MREFPGVHRSPQLLRSARAKHLTVLELRGCSKCTIRDYYADGRHSSDVIGERAESNGTRPNGWPRGYLRALRTLDSHSHPAPLKVRFFCAIALYIWFRLQASNAVSNSATDHPDREECQPSVTQPSCDVEYETVEPWLHTSSGKRTVTVLASSGLSAKVRETNPGPVELMIRNSSSSSGGDPRIMGLTQLGSRCPLTQFSFLATQQESHKPEVLGFSGYCWRWIQYITLSGVSDSGSRGTAHPPSVSSKSA